MTLTSLFLDDLGYEDLASDVADDFDYYRDAIESRAGNTLISNNTLQRVVCRDVSLNSHNYTERKYMDQIRYLRPDP